MLEAIVPVNVPSKSATKVATVYPVPLVFTVVVGCSSRFLNNLNLLSPVSLNKPAYKVVPLGAYLPYQPISTASVEVLLLATSINGSSTVNVSVSIVVVVPSTVKSPVTVRLPPTLALE